jgi:predicted outer membrane protein
MMILQTLSTVLLMATAQAGTTDQGLTDSELLRRLHAHHLRMAEVADLVRTRSTNSSVKTFATALANEHRRMDRVVESIASGMKITLGKPTNNEIAAVDNRGYANALTQMRKMTPDTNFDRAFLDLIGEDHNQFLNVIQTERKRTQNGRLREHLNDAYTMELKHRNRALELGGKKPPAAS